MYSRRRGDALVTDEVLQAVELAAAYVVVPAHRRHTEVVDPRLAEVGEHVAARLTVALPAS